MILLASGLQLLAVLLTAVVLLATGEPGHTLWRKEIAGGLPSAVSNLLFGDFLVVPTGDGTVEVFHAWNGSLVGSLKPSSPGGLYLDAIGASNEYVCILDANNRLSCLELSDGSAPIKSRLVAPEQYLLYSLSLGGGGRVAVLGNYVAVVLQLSDGKEQFRVTGESLAVSGDAIFSINKNDGVNKLVKTDFRTGKALWSREVPLESSVQCAGTDMVVTYEGQKKRVTGYDPNNGGSERFSFDTKDAGFFVGGCANDILFFGTEDAEVYVVNTTDVQHKIVFPGKISNVFVDIPRRRIVNYFLPGGSGGSPFVEALSLHDGKKLWKRFTPMSGNLPAVMAVGDDLVVPNLIGCNFFNINSGGAPEESSARGEARFGFPGGANIVAGRDPGSKQLVLFNFAKNASGKADLCAIAV